MSLFTRLPDELYFKIEVQLGFPDLARFFLTSKAGLQRGKTFKSLQIEHESLTHNKLRLIASLFPSLEHLSISHSEISGYDALENLRSLSKLNHLRLENNKFQVTIVRTSYLFWKSYEKQEDLIDLKFAHALTSLKKLEISFVNFQLYESQAEELEKNGVNVTPLL